MATKTAQKAQSKGAGNNGAQAKAQESQEQEIVISINLDNITFGDLEMALSYEEGKTPIKDIIPFFHRVVVGGVKNIPLSRAPEIMEKITEAFRDMGNPKNSEQG